MSYCRFGWDGSDVYVFGTSVNGKHVLECCGCILYGIGHSFSTFTEQQMIDHLVEHQAAGHTVPQVAFDRLEAERDGRPYRTTVEETLDEIRRNPQMFGKTIRELADELDKGPDTAVTKPFTCPTCKKTSWHPEDVRQGYCGSCHDFTGICQPEEGYHVTPHRGCVLR